MMHDQQLFVLGEFYLRKANPSVARDIFQKLYISNPSSYLVAFNLGKSEFKLTQYAQAIDHLEKSRILNPFHKSTLLLLSKTYEKTNNTSKALECMVDVYLLSKETKDSRLATYRKKVRNLSKKIGSEMDDHQKNQLTKDRLQYLNQQIVTLEKVRADIQPKDPPYSLEDSSEITIATLHEYEIGDHEIPIDFTPSTEPSPDPTELNQKLMAEIDEIVSHESEFEGIENPPVEESISNVVTTAPDQTDAFGDLRRHIMFKTLTQAELEKIRKFSNIEIFENQATIHTPLEPIYGFSCVLDGKVRIYHQNQSLMELESGSIIDEAELCNGSKYFFETRTVERSTILMINKAALLTLCKLQHELAVHFLWHFYKSLSLKINSIFESIIYKNPSQTLIWSLDRLQEISQQRTLNELELEYLAQRLPKSKFKKDDFIFKIHAHADIFYILLEGDIELQHPPSSETIEIKSGEYFSEVGLISNSFEHSMNAKVISDQATVLHINRKELSKLNDPDNRDNYRMMEVLWSIYSRKYFEFLNFYYHLLKS